MSGDMADRNIQEQTPPMTLGKGVGIYTMFLVGMVVLVSLASALSWFSGVIPFCTYFVFGYLMNRLVLRGLVEWHPVYNTLENVSRSKLRSLIFWPLSYPGLFFRLAVVKHL
jgi:hypothetical protein